MVHTVSRQIVAGKRARRAALLLSSAFGFAAITQAQAQATHEDTGPGPVSYTVDTVSGAPRAVLLSSPDGDVRAAIGTVTAVGAPGQVANVVEARVSGNNALGVTVQALTATGGDELTGIHTRAGTGVTRIEAGSIDLAGRKGISATSEGDVTIIARTVRVTGIEDGRDVDGISAGREEDENEINLPIAGSLTIDAGSVEVRGGGEESYAIHAEAIGDATIGVDTMVSDGEGIDVESDGDTTINLRGDVSTLGGAVSAGGDAVRITVASNAIVRAGGGAVEAEGSNTVSIVNNGTVINTGANGESGQGAILANGEGAITIVSNIAESNSDVVPFDDESATIQATSEAGPVNITAGTTTTNGGSMYGVWGRSTTGDVTIQANTTTTTKAATTGDYAGHAVFGSSDSGNVTITSGTATATSGMAIHGATSGGNVTITTTGNTTSSGNSAIAARGRNVTVRTGATTLTQGGTGSAHAVNMYATQGDAVLENAGTLTAGGSSPTVLVDAVGTIDIRSARTVNTGAAAAIVANGGRGVSIVADQVEVAGSVGNGVRGVSTTSGATTITVGNFQGSAANGAIHGQANNAAVTIRANNVVNTSTSVNGTGINGVGRGVTIVAGNVDAYSLAIRGTTTLSGPTGPVIPFNDGHVSIETTGAITSRTTNAISINGNVASFDVTIGENSVVTGNGGTATIAGGARVGNASVVNRGRIITQGTGETGIGVTAFGGGNVTVASRDITVNGTAPVSGQFTSGAISAVSTGGNGNVSVTSDRASVTGASRWGIVTSAVGTGTISVTSGVLSKDAAKNAGIQALTEQGDITIASTSLTNAGAGAHGIEARSSTGGDIAITNGTLVNTATGLADNVAVANGIDARTAGTVRVTNTSITAAGATSAGIVALGDGGVTIVSGAIDAVNHGVIATSQAITDVTVNGAVRGANASGLTANGTSVLVTVAQGGTLSSGVTGLFAQGSTATIVNNGSIAGGSSAAIVATGTTRLINAGTISAGANGLAATLGGADDTVVLQSGSNVTGLIDTGAGRDRVRLDGANGGTIARFVNAETLDVDTGRWTTGTTANAFQAVAIAAGAELQVNLAADGSSGIATAQANVLGTLVLNYTDTREAGDISDTMIAGTGTVRLIGAGEVAMAGNASGLTGTTRVENGALTLTGSLGSDVVTTGTGVFRLADGGLFTGDLRNDGTFIYDRTDSYTIVGDFSGTGALIKNGTGTLTLGGRYDFTGITTINGGLVEVTGRLAEDTVIDLDEGTLDLSNAQNGQQTIAELSGAANGTVSLGETQLTIDQASDTTFGGAITGSGGLVKDGEGTLDLTGSSTYTGPTQVAGGTLKVNGALPNSTVIVDDSGRLGGNGTIGGLAMNGGTLAPGNSIGRLSVNGPISFNAASVYEVEVNAAGAADRIDATGKATLSGGKVAVLAETGTYRGRTRYTILTAAGGVEGTFGSVTSNLAFLTPTLGYDATSVTLDLTRNDISFAALATTPNARAAGNAVQALGAGNPLFEEALFLSDSAVQSDFASLSGELYAGVASSMIEDARMLRRSLIAQPARGDEGAFGWATLVASRGTADATGRNARLKGEQQGILGGLGYAAGGLDFALGIGAFTADYRGFGHADVDSTVVTGTVRYSGGGFTGVVGASYAWHELDARRTATLGTLSDALLGEADASTRQVFGEIGYGMDLSGLTLTPFAGIGYVEVRRDRLVESGGATALALGADKRDATFADVGLRLAATPRAATGKGLAIAPYGSAAWRRAWGDRATAMRGSIGGAAGSFAILGPIVARDAADLSAGIEATVGPMRLSAGYEGMLSSNWKNHSAQLRFSIRF